MRCLFALLMLLGGCATDPSGAGRMPRVELGAEFPLAQHASVLLADSGFRLTFEKVLEDSRCPVAVSCVWEGNARVLLRLTALYDASASYALELNTQARFPASQSQGAFRVELRRLDPVPQADTPTLGYVAILSVSKT